MENIRLVNMGKLMFFKIERQGLIVMHQLQGVAASSGIVIAKAHHLEIAKPSIEKKRVDNIHGELERFEKAIEISKQEIREIRDEARKQLGDEDAEIFSAHLLMLEDPELIDQVKKRIMLENVNAELALSEIQTMVLNIFKSMDNFYMRERGADFEDVINRIMSHLIGTNVRKPLRIQEEVVLIADDLLPSDTAKLDRNFIKGFITSMGGLTSHSAIIARALEIPAVTGIQNEMDQVKQGDLIIVDGNDGVVIVNPTKEDLAYYQKKKQEFKQQKELWLDLKDEPTLTKDQYSVILSANISTLDEMEIVKRNGGQGIGLYRTEFLYMDRDALPSEEEQFQVYKSVLEQMGDKPVVIRTLDVGGDKDIDYLKLPEELNPFLGIRAIRFSLDNEDLFRPQLRALLRASPYGRLKIMFPMIATLDEFRQAKAILYEEQEKLQTAGVKVSSTIEIGIMVEIPSTAIMAHTFAKEVDFFSIGTNDLVQYTLAADRMNEQLSYLYQPYHPAILYLVNHVIEAARAEGKQVSMCGEMAGDEKAIPVLLALGLDQLSMSATSILPARAQIKNLDQGKLAAYKKQLLALGTAEEVLQFIKEFIL